MKRIIIGLLAIVFLSGCMDLSEKKYWKYKDYYISDNPGNLSKTLYINIEEGSGLGRVEGITKVSVVDDFILCESITASETGEVSFWILNMQHDSKYLNASEVVKGPFSSTEFSSLLEELEKPTNQTPFRQSKRTIGSQKFQKAKPRRPQQGRLKKNLIAVSSCPYPK